MKKPAEEISQAPRNNPGKFPEGFVFQLNEQEFENWKSQIVTSNWQRKRCHRDRGADIGASAAIGTEGTSDGIGTGWRPLAQALPSGQGADIGASVGIGSASAAIRTSAGIGIEAQEVEE